MPEIPRIVEVVVALALVVVLANLSESRPHLRPILYAILAGLSVMYIYGYTVIPADAAPLPSNPLAVSAIAFVSGGLAILLLFGPVRRRIARLFPARQLDNSGSVVGFDPGSMVHMTALILCMYLLSRTILTFVLAGGLPGLASDFTAIDPSELWTELAIWLTFALLGSGFFVRRSLRGTLARLGLRAPTVSELFAAAGMAFLLYAIAFTVGLLWQSIAPQDVYQQQNAVNQQINASITTMTLAFLIAFTAAVGEEIAFRGALQPIFGLWPTALFFASIHLQYVLTPASVLIFCVGLGLGWLRSKYNTTTSIVAHFLYDFAPAALYLLAQVSTANLPR